MTLTELEHQQIKRLLNWMITIVLLLLVIFFVLGFTYAHKTTRTQHEFMSEIDEFRDWIMVFKDDNTVFLISNTDTLILSFENNYGLRSINPVVLTNIH